MNSFLDWIAHVWRPHEGQRAFLESDSKIKVLACGRRWGKTDACAVSILACLFRGEPTRHVIIAPTQDQANLLFERVVSLLEELARGLETAGAETALKRTPYPKLVWGRHTVTARSGHLGRSLRGNEATHIVVDEAAYVPEELITEVAMPMLATTAGQITLISTPCGMNHFWRFFRMGQERQHGVWSRTAPSSESPYVSPDFLELQRDVISERAFRIEYEAAFLDSVGRVFRTEAIAACVVPALPAPPPDGPVCIGVDWGRSNDYTAVVVLQGTREGVHVLDVDRFTDEAWDAQLSRVRGILRRYPRALVSCDATGLGQPISEMLQQDPAGTRVFQVPFTEKVKESLVGNLAWAIENRRIKMLPQPDLIRELQHFEMTSGGRGAKYGAASGFHDDLVIALALAVSKIPHAYRPAIHRGQERRLA